MRMNTASSGTTRRQTNNSAPSSGRSTDEIDNSIEGLVGGNTATKHARGGKNNPTGNSSTSNVEKLFEELLGEEASAFGTVENPGNGGIANDGAGAVNGGENRNGEGEESTAMSSLIPSLSKMQVPLHRNNSLTKINEVGSPARESNRQDLNEREKKNNYGADYDYKNVENGEYGKHEDYGEETRQPQDNLDMNISFPNKSQSKNNNQQLSNRRQSEEEPDEHDEEHGRGKGGGDEDEDTYMTKPREIFVNSSDDVSGLFQTGGNGGYGGYGMDSVSENAEGVESFMGTFAAQRKNRRGVGKGGAFTLSGFGPVKRPGGEGGGSGGEGGGGGGRGGAAGARGGRGMGNRGGRGMGRSDVESRGTGASSTFKSHGVSSILEEFGLRPKGSITGESTAYTDTSEENKGHFNKFRRRSPRGGNAPSVMGDMEWTPRGVLERIKESVSQLRSSTVVILLVIFMYVVVQFPTMQQQNRAAMDHLNFRFQHQRYAPKDGAIDGMMPVDRGVGSGNNDLSGQSKGGQSGRQVQMKEVMVDDGMNVRRRKNYDIQENTYNDNFGGMKLTQGNIQFNDRNFNPNQLDSRGGMQGMGGMQMQVQMQNQQQDMGFSQQRQGMGNMGNVGNMQQDQTMGNMQHDQTMGNMQQDQTTGNMQQDQTTGNMRQQQRQQQPLQPVKQTGDSLNEIEPFVPITNDALPSRFSIFSDLSTPFVPGRDTPFFWHIPRSGGIVVKIMLSHCLGKTLASEVGEMDGHQNDQDLKVITFQDHKYVNVNVATPEGITRAKNLGLVQSHLADTIVSPHVDLIPPLFDNNNQGRAFVLLRHPVHRAASMYYFLKETGFPALKNMSLDDYARSEYIENNWLVRILSDTMTGPINSNNLDIAEEVLRRKFVVGLVENKRGTFARFDHYFKWKESPNYEKQFGCRKQVMDQVYVPSHPVKKDSDTWKLLFEQNRYDVLLYEFAQELFKQQSRLYGL